MFKRSVATVFGIGVLLIGVTSARVGATQDLGKEPFIRAAERVREAENQAVIVRLYFQFFNNHDASYANQVISKDFIQHNPTIPTGRAPFVGFLQSLFQQYPDSHWNVDRIAAGGDLVWVQTHQTNNLQDAGAEIMDIYRLKDGIIVEHWDAFEAVSSAPLNANTQF